MTVTMGCGCVWYDDYNDVEHDDGDYDHEDHDDSNDGDDDEVVYSLNGLWVQCWTWW